MPEMDLNKISKEFDKPLASKTKEEIGAWLKCPTCAGAGNLENTHFTREMLLRLLQRERLFNELKIDGNKARATIKELKTNIKKLRASQSRLRQRLKLLNTPPVKPFNQYVAGADNETITVTIETISPPY